MPNDGNDLNELKKKVVFMYPFLNIFTSQKSCESLLNVGGNQLFKPGVRIKPTIEVTRVVLRLQLRDEFSFLSQESIPVQTNEERVLFDLRGSACKHTSFLLEA